MEHPPITRFWHEESQYLVLLAVADENELLELRRRVEDARIVFSEYHEPDFDNELTALAIAPSVLTQKICANYPLALREASMA